MFTKKLVSIESIFTPMMCRETTNQNHLTFQSTVPILWEQRNLLVFENGLDPKNPLFAEKGDG